MSVGFDHVGLCVAELDAEQAFYERAFGFELQLSFDLPGEIRGAMLTHESGMRFELFERPGSRPGMQGSMPIPTLETRGYGHFALKAPDIDPVFARAVAEGARAMVQPGPSPEPGVRFAFLADPEGNLIELVERA
jgi:catechol 2,3-dioxygenase-like lactoylglutathione lyase family enzyme